MSRDQPEASTSTSPPSHPPPRNLVSLVVDSTLARDQYLKLIETNGVVHSLIQRLMEKHGGESHLLFNSRVIPIKAKNEPISPSIRSANAQGLRRFSAFLPTLPSLASCLTAASDNDIPWPSFTNDSAEPSNRLSVENVKIKQRERETCLLNGVVEGLELLSSSHDEAPTRPFLQSLSPPEATSLFSTIHDDRPGSRYIIILTGTPATQAALDARQTAMDVWEAVATTNWDPIWDGKSWRDVGTTSREKGISASCIIAGGEDSDSEISRNLRKLCQETSPNGFEDPWFDVPQDVDVAISGFGIDPGNVPSSPTAGGSSAPTEQIITPAAANIMEPTLNTNNPSNAAKVQLMQTQAMALRALAARATANGNPITQQTMFQLMQAVKAGTLDNNSPGLQQIKTLLALQQQQKQGQASMNPAAANAANAAAISGQAQGQGADQVILAAMHQQMLQQNQANGNNANGANASVPATLQRPNLPAQQAQQQQAQVVPPAKTPQRPGLNRERSQSQSQSQTRVRSNTPLWSGDIIWHNGSAARFTVSIDAVPIGENAALEYHTQFWPKELVINQIGAYQLGELQRLSKENRAPFVVFVPRITPSGHDASNTARYNNMATALARANNMATINITQDRGLAIFAPQQTGPEGEPRPSRLMGLVCMNCPLPLGKPANSTTNGNATGSRTTPSQGNAMLAPTPTSKIPTPIQTISPSYAQQQLQRPGAQPQQQQAQQQQPQQQQQQAQQQYMPNAGQQLTPQQAAQLAAAAQQRQQLQQQQLSLQQHQQQQQQLQQQQTQQLMQFQQQPSGQPQMMLTAEQDREFRALARVSNLDLGNFDPFNLDETKYRQIMACLATAREREKKQQQMQQQQQLLAQQQQQLQQQQQQQQYGQQPQQQQQQQPQQQMNLGQMGNFPFQQQQQQQQSQYNNGQNGFGGINMGMTQGFQQ